MELVMSGFDRTVVRPRTKDDRTVVRPLINGAHPPPTEAKLSCFGVAHNIPRTALPPPPTLSPLNPHPSRLSTEFQLLGVVCLES